MLPTFEREAVRLAVLPPAGGRAGLSERQVPVRVDGDGVHVDGALWVARPQMRSIALRLGADAAVVVSTVDKQTRVFRFHELSEAALLLEALGQPLARTRATFSASPNFDLGDVASWRRLRPVLLWTALALLIAVGAAFVLPKVGVVVGFQAIGTLGLLAVRSTVDVGTDGVRVRWLGMNRYYPFAAIARVVADEEAVVLELRSQEKITLRPSEGRSDDVVARIQAGLASVGTAPPAEDLAALHERSAGLGRVAELRHLGGTSDDTYRDGGLPRDRLWEVVEDPTHDAVARTNAAVALSGALDDEGRQRLRVVADATASPKVRVALERVASQANAEHLARALSDVVAEQEAEDEARPPAAGGTR